MAVLSELRRADLRKRLHQLLSQLGLPVSALKAEINATIDAADDWREANAVSFNQALPLAARNALNAKQKALILMLVIDEYYEAT